MITSKCLLCLVKFLICVLFLCQNVELVSAGRRVASTGNSTLDPEDNEGRILIAAFNMRKFGLPKVENEFVLKEIVKIVSRYHIIALSEITDRTGKALKRLIDRVNFEGRHAYHFVESKRVGRSKNKEQYAILYRPDLVHIKNHFVFNDSATDPFAREPQIAEISFPGYDRKVALVNIHTKPTDAVKEIDALTDVHAWIEKSLRIKDVVILGDLNADCSYVPKKSWKDIRLRSQDKFNWLVPDNADTTVGKTNCAYDRIIVTGPFFSEYVTPGSAKPYKFDAVLDEAKALQVSDHYPVEFEVRTGRPRLASPEHWRAEEDEGVDSRDKAIQGKSKVQENSETQKSGLGGRLKNWFRSLF